MKIRFLSLVSILPVFPISAKPGGPAVSRASFRGLGMLLFAGILLCCVVGFYFLRWYQKHPGWGKVILAGVGVLGIWQIVRFLKGACEDPLLRKTPYRAVELPEETLPEDKK